MEDRRLTARREYNCIFGTCKDCSKIVDGRGIHIIEVYQIYECDEELCGECDGDGTVSVTCPHCEGWGKIDERCDSCGGTGKQPAFMGDEKLVGEESMLLPKMKHGSNIPNERR